MKTRECTFGERENHNKTFADDGNGKLNRIEREQSEEFNWKKG